MTAMTTRDFRPKRVALAVTEGDSISLTCEVEQIGNLTNPVFAGRVKDGLGQHVEDFEVTPTADGAVLVLTPAQTRALGQLNDVGQVVAGGPGKTWHGYYDIQLSHEPNVVRTFMAGPFVIESDVTP